MIFSKVTECYYVYTKMKRGTGFMAVLSLKDMIKNEEK